ncbi:MAG TPA: hypothetical protein VMS73_06600 [Anaerolineaceae bacterium]|nr:hypothetical protein [Anaerolineaceae bacterium]
MKLDTPTIAIVVAIAFFYIKLVYMQWRKARQAARKTNIEIATARKKGKAPKIPEKPANERFSVQVRNWYVVVGMMALVFAGLFWQGNPFSLSAELVSFWWVPVSVGIAGLSFAIK